MKLGVESQHILDSSWIRGQSPSPMLYRLKAVTGWGWIWGSPASNCGGPLSAESEGAGEATS